RSGCGRRAAALQFGVTGSHGRITGADLLFFLVLVRNACLCLAPVGVGAGKLFLLHIRAALAAFVAASLDLGLAVGGVLGHGLHLGELGVHGCEIAGAPQVDFLLVRIGVDERRIKALLLGLLLGELGLVFLGLLFLGDALRLLFGPFVGLARHAALVEL